MFCNKCGQSVPPGSRFCNGCGSIVVGTVSPTASPVETLTAHPYSEIQDEQVVFSIRPTMLYVIAWYIVAVIILIAVAAAMGIASNTWPEQATPEFALWVILITGLVVMAIPVVKHILRRREVYTLTNHKLEMRYGILSKTVRNIPLRNIQDVTVTASAGQRILKIGDIEILSASETGKILLNEVHNPDHYGSKILNELRRRN